MRALKSTFLNVTLSIALTAVAQADEPRFAPSSLQSSIKTALERNPKIRSNGKVLEAMLLRVESQKLSQLPSLSVGYGQSQSMGSSYRSQNNTSEDFASRSRGGNVSLSWNIYDGFASHYRIKSMQCEYEQRKAILNSSDGQNSNTRGQIAGLVARYYLNLSRTRQVIYFNEEILKILNVFKKAAKNPRELADIEIVTNEITLSLQEQKDSETNAASDYAFVVTIPAPNELNSFQDIIESIKIPESSSAALEIANQKSPDILTARYQIDCMRLRLRSAKANANSPRIDFNASTNFGNQNTDIMSGSFNRSRSTTIGITIQKSFGAGTSSSLRADELDIEASTDHLDGAIADMKHNLSKIYPQLSSTMNLAESYKQNFIVSKGNIEQIIRDIEANKSVKVDDALKELSNLRQNWSSHLQFTGFIIDLKFQIQRTIGTLFESLGVKDLE